MIAQEKLKFFDFPTFLISQILREMFFNKQLNSPQKLIENLKIKNKIKGKVGYGPCRERKQNIVIFYRFPVILKQL